MDAKVRSLESAVSGGRWFMIMSMAVMQISLKKCKNSQVLMAQTIGLSMVGATNSTVNMTCIVCRVCLVYYFWAMTIFQHAICLELVIFFLVKWRQINTSLGDLRKKGHWKSKEKTSQNDQVLLHVPFLSV